MSLHIGGQFHPIISRNCVSHEECVLKESFEVSRANINVFRMALCFVRKGILSTYVC